MGPVLFVAVAVLSSLQVAFKPWVWLLTWMHFGTSLVVVGLMYTGCGVRCGVVTHCYEHSVYVLSRGTAAFLIGKYLYTRNDTVRDWGRVWLLTAAYTLQILGSKSL